MRLLFLNHNVRGVGTYLRAFHLARALVARGHSVTLVTTSAAARWVMRSENDGGVEVVEAPDLLTGRGRTGWDPWNVLRRALWLRMRAFDLIHAFDSRPVVIYPALFARRRTGAPLVMDWADWWGRGGWIQDRSGWLVRTLFGPFETWQEESFRVQAQGTTTISQALAERATKLGVSTQRLLWLPNGCRPDQVRPRAREAARARLRISASALLLVHLGVLTRGDLALLVEAFKQAYREQPALQLALVGRTAIAVSPTPGVILTGAVSQERLHDWLAAADACVVPCRDTIGNRGRWPSKVNDYLAAGRPVVMPRVGDVGTLIAERGAGWTTDASAPSFARGILDALGDKTGRERAAHAARQVAEQVLAWPLLAERLEQFYVRTLASGSSTDGVCVPGALAS
jgi:glycosyltransferase involved in cell wall biosynthesis